MTWRGFVAVIGAVALLQVVVATAIPAAASSAPTFASSAVSRTVGHYPILTAPAVTGTGALTITYRWQRASSSTGSFATITSATSASYALTAADENKYVRLYSWASNSFGTTFFVSDVVAFHRVVSNSSVLVPTGVSSVDLVVTAGRGGRPFNETTYSGGSYPGRIQGTIAVTPGQSLRIFLGANGRDATAVAAGGLGGTVDLSGTFLSGYGGGKGGSAGEVDTDSRGCNNPRTVFFASGGGAAASLVQLVSSDSAVLGTGVAGGAGGMTVRGQYKYYSPTYNSYLCSNQFPQPVTTPLPVASGTTGESDGATSTRGGGGGGALGGQKAAPMTNPYGPTVYIYDGYPGTNSVSGLPNLTERHAEWGARGYTFDGAAASLTYSITMDPLLTQTVAWAPVTTAATTASPLTPSVPAVGSAGGTITYAKVSNTTTSCSVNSSTGVLTFSGVGTCTVRATAEMTSTHSAATLDVVFTVTLPSCAPANGTSGAFSTWTFASTTTCTWSVPEGVTSVDVLAVGGGGSGGRGQGETSGAGSGGGGGGGGGGERRISTSQAVMPGDAFTVTVGAGGDGDVGTRPGGSSSVGALVVAMGGSGGGSPSYSSGGVGGTGGSGGSSTRGGNGGSGGTGWGGDVLATAFAGESYCPGSGGGGGTRQNGASNAFGAPGGMCQTVRTGGTGAGYSVANGRINPTVGSAGTGSGGGGGGYSGTSASVGADGGSGLIIIAFSEPGLTPTLGPTTPAGTGFTFEITNFDDTYSWLASATVGSATVSGSTVTVTGLPANTSSSVTVTSSRAGYANSTASVTGRQERLAQLVTWTPISAITTSSSPLTPSIGAATNGGGVVTYSIVSHTTSTCDVDAATGELTYSGTGECVVLATAGETVGYLEGSVDVTFIVTRGTQTVTWVPSTNITVIDSPSTPSVAASARGAAEITYMKVSNTTSTCTVDASTGALTYTGVGNCVVRATAPLTSDFETGFTDVTFTVAKATPSLTWNPALSVEVPAGSTTFAAAATSSDGAITYAVTNVGTTGCSLSVSSRVLTFASEGSCEVTATLDATDAYSTVTVVKTFAVSKAAQTVTWNPPSALMLTRLTENLPAASSSGSGALSYSVSNAGGTGCAFADPTSSVLTYTGSGACSITATATSTADFAQGTLSATLTIALGVPTLSWSPTRALAMPAATVTPIAATTTGDGAITYAVTSDTGANCTVDPATGAVTYTFTGQCQVIATSAVTSRYSASTTAVTFTVSLASQSITASASSTRLRPGDTATLLTSGSIGTGLVTWTRSGEIGICTLSGTTVTAAADGSCVLTAYIAADATHGAATSTITITVSTPGSGGGSSNGGGGPETPSGATSYSPSSSPGPGTTESSFPTESDDRIRLPGAATPTRGRALPPPPQDVEVTPAAGGSRSTVLIRQPAGSAGSQVLATVVVVRDAQGKVVSRITIELEPGQSQAKVTVPYISKGYTVNVYNVNEVGVSHGALTQSPLVRATTITRRAASGEPTLFGTMLGSPIIFDGGSARLDARDKAALRAIARIATASDQRIFVTGFARKGAGPADELAALSTRRAKAAATFLVKQGVRVWTRYWGAGSLNGSGTSLDRRAEVRTSAQPIPRSLVP